MRYIDTKKNFVQLVEVDDNNGKILSSRGFQFGELYFQIKNQKVTFYLNDSEVPYRNDIWTVNIPLQINDEVYDDEESASDALGEIMNDSFQEQLDELKEGLAAEEARAEEAEEQLDSKIDNETSRAISAETHLQDEITALSGTVATFDGRITKNTNDISALNSALQVEVERAIAKDATHDAQISGLADDIASEVSRAISAETQLHNDIINEQNRALAAESGITANLNTEIQNRIADVDAEEARALAAESSITENLNSEISRSTEKDAQHDAQISALTVSLNNEINRATEAENDLRSDLNNEIADRISGDTNLQNQLDAEITRAQNAEEGLDDKIDGEISRANSEETRIEGKLDAEITRSTAKDVEHDTLISGLTDDLDAEIARATARENVIDAKLDQEIADRIADVNAEENRAIAAEQALDSKIDNEITRSTAKDVEHDTLISGLTDDLASEVARATAKENQLDVKIDAEIANRISDVDAEETRALAAESGITSSINAEITRATNAETALNEKVNAISAYNASQDVQISGVSNSINTEISRATSVENALRSDLNNETSARTSADASLLERIVAVEVGKADANNVYTKAESDDKYATKEYMSGFSANYYDKNATNELLAAKADKVNAVASAEYVSASKKINFKNIDGTVISEVDATAFIKDGMVDNVEIVNGNLVITFNTDSGKEPISIPLTYIFDPSNYYNKTEIDNIENTQNSKINEISGKTDNIVTEVQTLSGEVQTISGESVTTGEVQTMIDSAVSGKADSNSVYTKTESDNKYQAKGDYITGAQMSAYTYDKTTIDQKVAEGGTFDPTQYYNKTATDALLSQKQNKLTAGTGISIQNDVISVTGGSEPVDAYTKAESDAKFATITNFNSHSGNTNIHVTASEKSTWNNKSDFSGDYNDLTNKPTIPNYTAGSGITISNNVISAKIWSGTKAQYDALSTKDADTIYLIYNS